MILRARIVLPISSPPIEDGAVLVRGDRVAQVGKWTDFDKGRERVVDLGEVVLLPGLVNAHCHLDYTNIAIGRGRKNFTAWVQEIIKRKNELSIADYRKAWVRGARMLQETGTTTVADIEAVPELLPAVWKKTSLRVISFLEMTGVASGKTPKDILADARDKISELRTRPAARSESAPYLSPHALYSTVPELLRLTARRTRNMRVTMHVAESEEEMEMYAKRRGPLFEWLSRFRDMSDCGATTPVQAVHRAGLLRDNFLAVHANYLTAQDVTLLSRSGASVVHCPSSHEYFGHRKFPFAQLDRAGVNICLGTDSVASMRRRELDMFCEMRQFAKVYPSVKHAQILRMATTSGAKALGFAGRIGEFCNGACADAIAIPFCSKISQAVSAVLYTKNVQSVFVGGKVVK